MPQRRIGRERIACPGVGLVTSRSPILIAPYRASAFTLTRPLCATIALLSLFSPSTRPGCRDTAPATRVSYAFGAASTRFGLAGSTMTIVPGSSGAAVSTHSATS